RPAVTARARSRPAAPVGSPDRRPRNGPRNDDTPPPSLDTRPEPEGADRTWGTLAHKTGFSSFRHLLLPRTQGVPNLRKPQSAGKYFSLKGRNRALRPLGGLPTSPVPPPLMPRHF